MFTACVPLHPSSSGVWSFESTFLFDQVIRPRWDFNLLPTPPYSLIVPAYIISQSFGPRRPPTHVPFLMVRISSAYLLRRGTLKKREPDVVMSTFCEVRLVGYLSGSSSWRSIKVCNQCSNRCSSPWVTWGCSYKSLHPHLLENEREIDGCLWLLRVYWEVIWLLCFPKIVWL